VAASVKPEQWCIEKAKDVVDAKTQGTICFTLQNLETEQGHICVGHWQRKAEFRQMS